MPPTTTGPAGLSGVEPVPRTRTARRLEWPLLPPPVRRLVEDRFGTRVVHASSVSSGFTPGLASLLTGEDGRRMFLKAASRKAQRPFAEAYAHEAAVLRALPLGLPVPRLLWSHQDDLWMLLALEHLDGVPPARPWDAAELTLCLDRLEVLARTLTPSPVPLPSFARGFAGFPAGWDHVRRTTPDWPHLEEAAALAGRWRAATAGSTLVHCDARDDSFVVAADGAAHLCGWGLSVLGAPWVDTVCLLMTAFGDGVDADVLLGTRALTRYVSADDVDALLALLCGYFLERRDQPVPHSSPFLRRHQDWCAEACWAWLAHRRGWR